MSSTNTIICCACGKETPRSRAFRMYEFVCCSNKCIEPLRLKRQADEKLEKEKHDKKFTPGAFTLSSGGCF